MKRLMQALSWSLWMAPVPRPDIWRLPDAPDFSQKPITLTRELYRIHHGPASCRQAHTRIGPHSMPEAYLEYERVEDLLGKGFARLRAVRPISTWCG